MQNDIYYMNIALNEAKKALKKGEVPIGAVIVKNNKIIAKGYNLRETKNISTKHAEIIVIEKSCKKINNWRLLDCTIYVTMLPCYMCASAINQSRISRIVYGTVPTDVDKSLTYSILNNKKYGNPVEIVENVLANECAELLKKFFLKKRG